MTRCVLPSYRGARFFAKLKINALQECYRAYIHDQDLILTRKEFTILWLLAKKPGQIISRVELLRRVWGYHLMDDDRMIDTHLNRLRKKLHGEPPSIRIKTVWGIGYQLETDKN
jgi:DNA-binding response OmpR family regulator